METLELDIAVPLRAFDVELTLAVGAETLALVGRTGAGKTTVLRAIAGLARPARGSIRLGDAVWFDGRTDLPPEQRSVGLVFQDYALFPHMSVRGNVHFATRDRARADAMLRRFELSALADARPAALSGGERQRVALARAMARDPAVLLLDEPLAALDAQTRAEVRAELVTALGEAGRPTIMVTHDYVDAATLADRIGVMRDGRLLQLGTPAELVSRPADPFVATLTGANVLQGVARPGREGMTEVVLDSGTTVYSTDAGTGSVSVVVHPWEIIVAHRASETSSLNVVTGRITSIAALGPRVRVGIDRLIGEITASSAARLDLRIGEPAVAMFKATATRLLG